MFGRKVQLGTRIVLLICLVAANRGSLANAISQGVRDSSPSGIIRVPLTRYKDNMFYGKIGVGTPRQEFNVLFSNQMSTLWVPMANSNSTSVYFHTHKLYDHSKSSTYKKDSRLVTTIQPRSILGEVFLVLSNDVVQLGGVSIQGQIFGELFDVISDSGGYDGLHEMNGIFGLGSSIHTVAMDVKTPFENMINEKLVPEPIYSFHFKSASSAARSEAGELILGGIDRNLLSGEVNYLPAGSNKYFDWLLRMQSIKINDDSVGCAKGCLATLDSGSRYILGPLDEVQNLNARLGAYRDSENWRWIFPTCENLNRLPTIMFKLGNNEFSLTWEHYVNRVQASPNLTYCVSAFGADRSLNSEYGDSLWLLGTPFMEAYYTIFDFENSRVGVANLKHK